VEKKALEDKCVDWVAGNPLASSQNLDSSWPRSPRTGPLTPAAVRGDDEDDALRGTKHFSVLNSGLNSSRCDSETSTQSHSNSGHETADEEELLLCKRCVCGCGGGGGRAVCTFAFHDSTIDAALYVYTTC